MESLIEISRFLLNANVFLFQTCQGLYGSLAGNRHWDPWARSIYCHGSEMLSSLIKKCTNSSPEITILLFQMLYICLNLCKKLIKLTSSSLIFPYPIAFIKQSRLSETFCNIISSLQTLLRVSFIIMELEIMKSNAWTNPRVHFIFLFSGMCCISFLPNHKTVSHP